MIITSDVPPGTAFTTALVVKVLYESITDMATRQPGFYQVAGYIEINGKRVGRMYIGSTNLSLNDEDVLNATLTANSPRSIESSFVGELDTGNITQPSNSDEIIDPHDRRFKITWKWETKNIPAQDIFSAALNGLATVAQYDYNGPCDYITALSTLGNAVFHIGRSTGATLLASTISRAFYLLINQLFLGQRRFKELWIYLSIDGVNIADGYIHKVERVGAGNVIGGVTSE